MSYDLTLPSKFSDILESGESVAWTGKPHFVPYLISGVPILIFGCLWGAFDYFGFIRHMPDSMAGFAIPFFTLHLIPFWGSILYMLALVLSFHNVAYAITNRRLILRGGVAAPSFKTFDLKQIFNLAVSAGPFEKSVGAGSVSFAYGQYVMRNGTPTARQERFRAIDDPYAVHRQLSELLEKTSSQGPSQSAGTGAISPS